MADDWSFTHDDATPPVFIPGNREVWGDVVFNVNKTDTPLSQRVRRNGKMDAVQKTWMVEELNAFSGARSQDKAQGFTPSATETPRYECKNYTSLFSKMAEVTMSAQQQFHIGVKSELSRQIINHAKVLKMDVEHLTATGVHRSPPTAGTTASRAMGFPGLIAYFGDITKHVDGTRRYGTLNTTNVSILDDNFQEDGTTYHAFTNFKTIQQRLWKRGSKASECYCSIENKALVSTGWDANGVTRYTTRIEEVKELIDVIVTDGGTVMFIPYRGFSTYSQAAAATFDKTAGAHVTDFALLIDPNYCAINMFRDYEDTALGITKDAWQRYLAVEFSPEISMPYAMAVFNFSGNSAYTTDVPLFQTAASYDL
jgi:hypothetical protein